MNDFAASISIARDGFAQMAVAGAYAGPMFNILAGIGLPFLIKILSSGGEKQECGDREGGGQPETNPILWMAYIHLIIALSVTLAWVPLSGECLRLEEYYVKKQQPCVCSLPTAFLSLPCHTHPTPFAFNFCGA